MKLPGICFPSAFAFAGRWTEGLRASLQDPASICCYLVRAGPSESPCPPSRFLEIVCDSDRMPIPQTHFDYLGKKAVGAIRVLVFVRFAREGDSQEPGGIG